MKTLRSQQKTKARQHATHAHVKCVQICAHISHTHKHISESIICTYGETIVSARARTALSHRAAQLSIHNKLNQQENLCVPYCHLCALVLFVSACVVHAEFPARITHARIRVHICMRHGICASAISRTALELCTSCVCMGCDRYDNVAHMFDTATRPRRR